LKKSLNRSEYELLRLRAWSLHQKKWKQKKIAEALGVGQSTISKWIKRGKNNSINGLKTKKSLGAIVKFTKNQLTNLKRHIQIGAHYHDFPDNKWINKRIKEVIKKLFNVEYTEQHVGRLIKKIS